MEQAHRSEAVLARGTIRLRQIDLGDRKRPRTIATIGREVEADESVGIARYHAADLQMVLLLRVVGTLVQTPALRCH